MDLITIIVPIYNAEDYLESCIKSILNQTYTNFELILVDDGSKDKSLNICNKYCTIDRRIRVVSKENGGVSEARNVGMELAKGKYIAFVDSDDIIKERMIETLYYNTKKTDADLTVCNYEYDYSGRRLSKKHRIDSGVYRVESLKEIIIDDGTMSGILFGSVCTCLYKKEIIDNNNIRFKKNIKYNEDGLFNLEYIKNCQFVCVLSNHHLYIYRSNLNSVTNSVNLDKDRYKEVDAEISKLFSNKEIKNIEEQLSARKVSVNFWLILGICKKGNNDSIVRKLKTIKSICHDPQLVNGLNYINLKKINSYKKLYYYLIKHEKALIIYLITRYIYPRLKKIIVR